MAWAACLRQHKIEWEKDLKTAGQRDIFRLDGRAERGEEKKEMKKLCREAKSCETHEEENKSRTIQRILTNKCVWGLSSQQNLMERSRFNAM